MATGRRAKRILRLFEMLTFCSDSFARLPLASLNDLGETGVTLVRSVLGYPAVALLLSDGRGTEPTLARLGIDDAAGAHWSCRNPLLQHLWKTVGAPCTLRAEELTSEYAVALDELGLTAPALVVPIQTVSETQQVCVGLVLASGAAVGAEIEVDLLALDILASLIAGAYSHCVARRELEGNNQTLRSEIAERRRAESTLDAERRQLLSIFDSIDEPVYVSDPETYELLYANEAFRRLWGDGIGQKCHRVLQDLDQPCPFCTNDRILGEHLGRGYVWEFQNTTTRRWFRCMDKAIRWPDGRWVRYEMAIDITKRKQIEQTLGEAEERYRLLAENATDLITRVDTGGVLQYVSPAARLLVGYEPNELVGRAVTDFVRGLQAAELRRTYVRAMRRDAPVRFEFSVTHKDGREIWLETTARARRDAATGEVAEIICVSRDVSDRRRAEDNLREAATHDALTGLPNRAMFLRRLADESRRAQRDADYGFAVYFLDFDRFKVINDSLGHHVGDLFLKEIARRLRGLTEERPDGQRTVARLGGDEFTVLVSGIRTEEEATGFARCLRYCLGAPYNLGGHEVLATVSIGIVLGHEECPHADDLLRDADIAMYRAKAAGRACHVVFDERMRDEAREALEMEKDLRHAIVRDELRLFYQPIVSLETGALYGFEALLRWVHPQKGMIPPNSFIALAEETGLIIPVGEWVLEEACRQLRAWHEQFPGATPRVSINVSKRQLLDPTLKHRLTAILADPGFDARWLKIEVTESVIMDDFETITRGLETLKQMGLQILMDDFGTGQSSLARLNEFPIDAIKIDRAFVNSMTRTRQLAAIIHAIVTLARNLNMEIIAEGVETEEQLAQLLSLGCSFAQGYHFARPMAVEDATKLLAGPLPWLASAGGAEEAGPAGSLAGG